ncbi:hypothetical protein ZWY2020_026373 [Hordeum vulgare]|nr:hypothetical protein ZWY2020_026373 [Hordeum vulgare]
MSSGLPPPFSNVTPLLEVLHKLGHGLDATDLVALSDGHTIGLGHCTSFEKWLYPGSDPSMSPSFVARLKQTCPAMGTRSSTALDVGTPNVFDNKYFVNLLNREGLFVYDQDLYTNTMVLATRHRLLPIADPDSQKLSAKRMVSCVPAN